MDAEPLPLGVPVPVTISVPRHQATNGDGFVFSVEATCTSLCELYTPVAAAHARDVIVASAQEAARAEMVQGGWNYESIYLGSTKELAMERFAERVLARMVSSARSSGDDSSTAIVFTNYNVTTLLLDPAATLAFAATQYLDPAIRLVAAAWAELVRQIRMDGAGHMRTTQERLEEASKAMSSFVKVFGADKPTPPPQRRSWILGLFQFIIAFVLALSVGLLGYSHFFPEQWAAKSDAVIQGYANSFRYYASGGYMGETLVQRHKRLLAEAERQLQEEKRKKAEELKRLKREEERLKKLEERRRKEEAYEVWRRAEAHAEHLMTPLQRFFYRNNIGNRRFKRYPRP